MDVQVLDFIPPVVGVEGEFNTFRLGGTMAKRLSVGQEVFLMDNKKKVVFGKAEVVSVEEGKLGELCLNHAHNNHTELGNDPADAPAGLYRYIQKLFGPHIVNPTKKACVIYLKRIE